MDKNTLWAVAIIAFVVLLGWFVFSQDSQTNLETDEQVTENEDDTAQTETQNPSTPSQTTTQPPVQQKPLQEIPEGTVYYTNSGFSPSTIVVTAGNAISFVNKSDTALRIIPNPEFGETAYKGLRQSTSVPKGSVFVFSFTQIGTWGYQNLNNKNHTGFVTVLPQPN